MGSFDSLSFPPSFASRSARSLSFLSFLSFFLALSFSALSDGRPKAAPFGFVELATTLGESLPLGGGDVGVEGLVLTT
jgi:hypothetical protein